MEVLQEVEKLVLVPAQDGLNLRRLLGVSHEDLVTHRCQKKTEI